MPESFDAIEDALAAVIRSAASPAVQEAQALLLRRLALEGSVLPSRIPPPANITEFGGYLNLLAGSDMSDMRASALASALGLASPAAISWDEAPPALGWGQVANDPAMVAAKPGLALSVPMRADIAQAWRTSVAPKLQSLGAVLPLWAPALRLPEPNPLAPMPDPLPLLGRVVWIAPEAAMADPDTDTILLGRADTDPADQLNIMVRVDVSSGIAPVDWNSLVWDDMANVVLTRAIGPTRAAHIAPIVALAGFVPVAMPPFPSARFDLRWTRLTNLGGLMPSTTTLGEELRQLWSSRDIARSAFAKQAHAVWNGRQFENRP